MIVILTGARNKKNMSALYILYTVLYIVHRAEIVFVTGTCGYTLKLHVTNPYAPKTLTGYSQRPYDIISGI